MNLVVSQALATGLPVIATRHSGLPEQVVDGENGFLVDEGDFEELAERILRIAEQPELLPAFGAAGRMHVVERYNAATLIERQLSAYRELVAARIHAPTHGP
ncbi:MAG: group 1 glycosyl transferase [Thermoleophilia bacterium]|nr:group 1 glycosyl transferase [Thermoleophilia bacterium]